MPDDPRTYLLSYESDGSRARILDAKLEAGSRSCLDLHVVACPAGGAYAINVEARCESEPDAGQVRDMIGSILFDLATRS